MKFTERKGKKAMQHSLKSSRLAWLVALALSGVQAQESTVILGEVTVSSGNAGSLPTRSILTSVDVMGAERVQDKNVANSWELIGQMPGVQLTEFRLGAESGKPSFRAFNGEGYINGIKLLIDGVPSNVNSGNMRYLDMIFPLDIDYVEVVRGTNSNAFGANALNQPDTFTLGAALAEGTISLNARAVAVLLGSFSFGPPGSDVVKDLWVKGVVQGSYATLGYKSEHTVWRRNEVEKYFDYLLGLNPGTP